MRRESSLLGTYRGEDLCIRGTEASGRNFHWTFSSPETWDENFHTVSLSFLWEM